MNFQRRIISITFVKGYTLMQAKGLPATCVDDEKDRQLHLFLLTFKIVPSL